MYVMLEDVDMLCCADNGDDDEAGQQQPPVHRALPAGR